MKTEEQIDQDQMQEQKGDPDFVNPIDADKIAENPHLLPYAHSVGGVVIKPIDKGKVKGQAVEAMYQQTDRQLDQLRKQAEILVQQAKKIHERVRISEAIYEADMGIKPLIGHVYFLYRRSNGKFLLSLVSPEEWGANGPYEFLAKVTMLSDHTWHIDNASSDFVWEDQSTEPEQE